MEAVPRLPMISFDLKTSTEPVLFGPQLKKYISNFYNEDPESYNTEISNLESLRGAAVRPSLDVEGCQLMKKYFCQLHFLKSRFPMSDLQAAAVYFSWKDPYASLSFSLPDINFELMAILYNIGALHSYLGANDSRTSPDGMKMACTHFQCAAWAFQTVKDTYYQSIAYISSIEVVHFMQQVCLAQAQECILEKSMMDNRKATIIAKVAVQVVDYYKRALSTLQSCSTDNPASDFIATKTNKEWFKYLSFKISYHKCISLLFQGQQAEEQQKMGERVAFYQIACEQLDEARKLSSDLKQQKEIAEAIAFTSDVVEGKRKAAKNENEFIYHEEVPEKEALQDVKGASLVKGIPFSINDVEVSGPDIFSRLIPMEAHEASSLYSEKKAQMLRQMGELVENKDQALAEFMSSMQLEILQQMKQAHGLPQEIVDRAAALSAKPTACQDLINVMGKLSNSYHEVEAMLNEIQALLKDEEKNEKDYQDLMGSRPPSIIATDLSREAAKYKEAHNKANESNQNLHKAMTTHVANLKILGQPLKQLNQQIPFVELPNSNVDEEALKDLEMLISKVDEMKSQRVMLWSQFREAVHNDDITGVLVTRQADQTLDQLFQHELQKHQTLASYIEQNAAAQENILKTFVDVYARFTNSRRYLQDTVNKRNNLITGLITSFDTYEDLLAKAHKGIEFYNKLETNVSKLLQRIKSACKVQQEERDQILSKNTPSNTTSIRDDISNPTPKLKDYLESRKKSPYIVQYSNHSWPAEVRPAPVGSEVNSDIKLSYKINEQNMNYSQKPPTSIDDLSERFANLRAAYQKDITSTTNSYQPISSVTPHVPEYYQYYDGKNVPLNNPSDIYQNTTVPMYQTQQQPFQPIPLPNSQIYQSPSNTATSQYYQSDIATNYPNNYYQQTYDINTNDSYQSIGSVTNLNQLPSQNYSITTPTNSQTYLNVTPQTYTNSTNIIPSSYSNTSLYSQNYSNTSLNNATTYSNAYGINYQTPPSQSFPESIPFSNYHQTTDIQNFNNTNISVTPQPSCSGTSSSGSDALYSFGSNITTQLPTAVTFQNLTSYQNYPENYSIYQQTQLPTITSQNFSIDYPNYSYYNQDYYNYYHPENVTVTTSIDNISVVSSTSSSSSSSLLSTTVPPIITKESNIDLLSGLDFTINQAPLIPEQQKLPEISSSLTEIQLNNSQISIEKQLINNDDDDDGVDDNDDNDNGINDLEKIKSSLTKIILKPLNNNDVKKLFLQEIDKFKKFVDVLNNKTLNGPTNLELKWKEIQDKQDSDNIKKVISVARCYPLKNRYSDILPYDCTRVELKNSNDDYINASFINNITNYSPNFIITQAPLPSTFNDFWTMIWEQKVEILICLLNKNEVTDIYWPEVKGKYLSFNNNMIISLINENIKTNCIERLITISLPEKRETRTIIHLQFTSWPGSIFPTTPDKYINFLLELIQYYYKQRNILNPLAIHCTSGIGRSGLTCLLIIAIIEVTNITNNLPDFVSLISKLNIARKNILRDREHLKFAYEAFLFYMKQLINNDNNNSTTTNDNDNDGDDNSGEGCNIDKLNEMVEVKNYEKKSENVKEISDPFSDLDPLWANKKEK